MSMKLQIDIAKGVTLTVLYQDSIAPIVIFGLGETIRSCHPSSDFIASLNDCTRRISPVIPAPTITAIVKQWLSAIMAFA